MKTKIFYFFIILIIELSALTAINQVSSAATEDYDIWAIAQNIPFYTDIYPPDLVADKNRTVHAFNSLATELGNPVIQYRQWRLDQGWSRPYDILLPNTEESYPLQGEILDDEGKFHLILFGGFLEYDTGRIEYSTAWAENAGQPKGWSKPIPIAVRAGPLISASIEGDGKNILYVVYAGQKAGTGVYEVHSIDAGKTWTEPIPITIIKNDEHSPTNIQLELDPDGNLHAVWGLVNTAGLGDAVYYARRDAVLGTWSDPILLAAKEGNDYAADWPSILYYQGELIVMYQDGTVPIGIPPTRWMRRSRDNGSTWSMPVQPFPQVGGYGAAVMLVDNNETLHIIVANRIGNPAVGGIWHAVWLGEMWSQLELITADSPGDATIHGSYESVGYASRPSAVISQGNVILATWWHDMLDQPPAGYSYTILDAPETALELLPSPTVIPSIVPLSSTELGLAPTGTPKPISTTMISPEARNGDVSSPTRSLMLSLASVVFLLSIIFIAYRFFISRSR